MIGDPGEIEPLGRPHELPPLGGFEPSRAAQVDIEPAKRRGDADVERLAEAAQIRGKRARRLERSRHRRSEQRTRVDRDDVVRAHAHEADRVRRAMRETGMEGGATPPRAMRVDQRSDLGGDARPRERAEEKAALPFAVESVRHVLSGAAAASSVPGTDWLGAFGAPAHNLNVFRAVADEPRAGLLAGQRAGDDRAICGDSVAVCVEGDDRKLFEGLNHGEPQ